MSTVRIGDFEWDAEKAAKNEKKHRISFHEAAECFVDPRGLDLADRLHPARFLLIAFSKSQRILSVVYAERVQGDIVRIISARRATPHEKKLYQDQS